MKSQLHSHSLQTVLVNGKEIECAVNVYCDHSDLSLDDVIGDAEDKQDLERKIQRGDLMLADILVTVTVKGLSGLDSLGGCYISSPEDVDMYLQDHDMVQLAKADLVKSIEMMHENLNAIFVK